MQFYIIHEDPAKNVELLPEYALKKVNAREGWQILSDIGHIHGVSWEGQNKLYSASHVLTRSFCQNLDEFDRFYRHYEVCVGFVGGSFLKKSQLFQKSDAVRELSHAIPLSRTREEFVLEYLLEQKNICWNKKRST